MSHDTAAFEQQLNALLDGRLSEEEAGAVREHLGECDECQALYQRLGSAHRVLRSVPAPAVPIGLLSRIQADARAEMERMAAPSIWRRWSAPLAGVAAAAAVLLAVFTPWQALHRDPAPEMCPLTEQPAVVAESPTDAPEVSTIEIESEAVEVADVGDAAEARTEEVATVPESSRPARRVARAPLSPSPAASVQADAPADEDPEKVMAPEPAPAAPQLASAPRSDGSVAATGPVLSEPGRPTVIALGPRTTVEDEPTLEPAVPAELESEMTAGLLAGMVLDQFVAEHMVQSSATMLSVVTDTPTSELGPVVAEDDDEVGSFGFSFTDAMRRALTESENQLP